ncbi:MAG: hypothetical protein K5886_03070 [Lachnospiraceae bacterium]|nr:hypothetical protein [Lachnospiraceae bacterium]
MKKESFKVIMILLVPKVVHLIMENDGLDEIRACIAFYSSDLYAALEQEENDMWQMEPAELYALYAKEQRMRKDPRNEQ